MNILRTSLTTALCVLITASAWAGTLKVGPTRTIQKIQSAVTAASSGDTILIDAGTYAENVIVSTAALVIRPAKKGKKGRVTIDASVGIGLGIAFASGSDGSVVKDIYVDGPFHALGGIFLGNTRAIKVIGCRVMNSTSHGITLASSVSCTVKKCVVTDSGGSAFVLSNSSFSSLKQCKAMDAKSHGIVVESDSVSILDNKITRSGLDGIMMGVVGSSSTCHGSLISNNVIVDSGDDGIQFTSQSEACVVEKNKVRRSADGGVVVNGTRDHLITGNSISDSGTDGFWVNNSTALLLHKNKSKYSKYDNFDLLSASSSVTLKKNKSRRAGDNGFEIEGNDHQVVKNDSGKSGLNTLAGLDFETASSAGCFFWKNVYDTSDF